MVSATLLVNRSNMDDDGYYRMAIRDADNIKEDLIDGGTERIRKWKPREQGEWNEEAKHYVAINP